MAPSPEMIRAFEAWKLAELACHYAELCPDAVMDNLVSIQSEAFAALQALPPNTGDDMLLKLFAVLVREFEPKTGEPPLRPSESRNYSYDPALLDRLRDQLGHVSPILRDAMAEPHPTQGRH